MEDRPCLTYIHGPSLKLTRLQTNLTCATQCHTSILLDMSPITLRASGRAKFDLNKQRQPVKRADDARERSHGWHRPASAQKLRAEAVPQISYRGSGYDLVSIDTQLEERNFPNKWWLIWRGLLGGCYTIWNEYRGSWLLTYRSVRTWNAPTWLNMCHAYLKRSGQATIGKEAYRGKSQDRIRETQGWAHKAIKRKGATFKRLHR